LKNKMREQVIMTIETNEALLSKDAHGAAASLSKAAEDAKALLSKAAEDARALLSKTAEAIEADEPAKVLLSKATEDAKTLLTEATKTAEVLLGKSAADAVTLLSKATMTAEVLLARVKRLEGIIPICSYCKKIRDDQNSWQQLEQYLSEHSEALFSHGICPHCAERQMSNVKSFKT
jgi:vacuolar-type H+-ATPase subunit H